MLLNLEIGFITHKRVVLSRLAERYIDILKRFVID